MNEDFIKQLAQAINDRQDAETEPTPAYVFEIPNADVRGLYALHDQLYAANPAVCVRHCEVWHDLLLRYPELNRFKKMVFVRDSIVKPVIKVYSYVDVDIPSSMLAIPYDHPQAAELRVLLNGLAAEPDKPTFELAYRAAVITLDCGLPPTVPLNTGGTVFNDLMLFPKTDKAMTQLDMAQTRSLAPVTN